MKDELLQRLGKNIHKLRNEAALTQEQLAEKADLSRRFIQEMEAGEKAPAVATLSRLRNALGCSYDDLLSGI